MWSAKRDSLDSPSSVGHDHNRRRSIQSNAARVLPGQVHSGNDIVATTALSPPPDPHQSKPRKDAIHVRLRSDSGLSFHTNAAALRQYTGYNNDGSLRPPQKRARSS